jgi:hypothetical protein
MKRKEGKERGKEDDFYPSITEIFPFQLHSCKNFNPTASFRFSMEKLVNSLSAIPGKLASQL